MNILRTTYKERNFTDYTKRTLPVHSDRTWTVCYTKFSTFFISLIQNLIHFTCQKALKKTKPQFSRTFQGKMEFKDFLRTCPKIQGLLNSRLNETLQDQWSSACHVSRTMWKCGVWNGFSITLLIMQKFNKKYSPQRLQIGCFSSGRKQRRRYISVCSCINTEHPRPF